MSKIDVVESLMDRIDNDGIAFSTLDDCYILGISVATLRELLEKAEANENGHAILMVQRPNPNKA